jgi:predicted nucleotidyltransferase
MDSALKFAGILKALSGHGVEYILVGGIAAILEGAPISTFDLDIVFLKTDDNLKRLLDALHELEARYLDPAGRHLAPDATKMATLRMHQLVTSMGPMDAMATIGKGLSYADLVGDTKISEIGGFEVRVLGLTSIILSKEQANRDKDRATLPILRRTLQLKKDGRASES